MIETPNNEASSASRTATSATVPRARRRTHRHGRQQVGGSPDVEETYRASRPSLRRICVASQRRGRAGRRAEHGEAAAGGAGAAQGDRPPRAVVLSMSCDSVEEPHNSTRQAAGDVALPQLRLEHRHTRIAREDHLGQADRTAHLPNKVPETKKTAPVLHRVGPAMAGVVLKGVSDARRQVKHLPSRSTGCARSNCRRRGGGDARSAWRPWLRCLRPAAALRWSPRANTFCDTSAPHNRGVTAIADEPGLEAAPQGRRPPQHRRHRSEARAAARKGQFCSRRPSASPTRACVAARTRRSARIVFFHLFACGTDFEFEGQTAVGANCSTVRFRFSCTSSCRRGAAGRQQHAQAARALYAQVRPAQARKTSRLPRAHIARSSARYHRSLLRLHAVEAGFALGRRHTWLQQLMH